MDTKNILFVCGGAFVGLEHQVAQRLTSSSIGFGNPVRYLPRSPCSLLFGKEQDQSIRIRASPWQLARSLTEPLLQMHRWAL